MLGLDFIGHSFHDNFLIADVTMAAEFPTERWFWFDPPFNRGRSALLHKQPDGVWRIDLQLGQDIDREREKRTENVLPRLQAMLGGDTKFSLEWVSIYTFQCRRLAKFRHGRVIFAGDSAHQVSPFGARGANSGIQDADNLCWKLKLVIDGKAPDRLLDSYDWERVKAADENILNSTRSTDFIAPKSPISRTFRNAVLDLAERHSLARPLVNSGRLSVPCIYDGSPIIGPDCPDLPARSRPGAPAPDGPVGDYWLLDRLGGGFQLLCFGCKAESTHVDDIEVTAVSIDPGPALRERYLGRESSAVYLMRPDQHIAARWKTLDQAELRQAVNRAVGRS